MEKHLLKQAVTYMFNKKEAIIVQPSENLDSSFKTQKEQVDYISAMLVNLNDLGYEIPTRDIAKLLTMSPQDLNEYVYQPVLQAAKEQKGAHVEHNILFKGFPESVRNIDESVLSNIRFMSYWTTAVEAIWGLDTHKDGSLTRDFVEHALQTAKLDIATRGKSDAELMQASAEAIAKKKEERGLTEDKSKIRTVRAVSEEDYFQMVKNMLSAKSALPEYDKEIVLFTVDNFPQEKYMPEKVQFRETQALLDVHNFKNGQYHNINVATTKDFERLLAALSDGDVSLRKKQLYRNFSNQERRALAEIFETAVKKNRFTMVASMATKYGTQLTKNVLKDKLHFNAEGHKSYFKDKNLWKNLIDDVSKYRSTMSYFEEHMKKKEYAQAAKVLERYSPTLLMQHAREIVGKACLEEELIKNSTFMTGTETQLRKAMIRNEISNVESSIRSAARKTDAVTLLKTITQATYGNDEIKVIRDSKANGLILKENKSVRLTADAAAILINAAKAGIFHQYKHSSVNEQLPIGKGVKVYFEKALDGCPIPTDDRAAQGKNRLLPPGTRVPMAEGDTLQVSLYKKAETDQFIDHSFVVLDENYQPVVQGSWNKMQNIVRNAHGERELSTFSGDSMRCSQGVTETHRINLDVLKEEYPKARYIAFSAIMWSGTPMESCQELFMAAETFNRNERQLEPLKNGQAPIDFKDVQMKMDITGQKPAGIPMLFDLQEQTMVVVNVELGRVGSCLEIESALRAPVHFKLPKGCEAVENYKTDIAAKCFAVNRPTCVNIAELTNLMVQAKGAVLVDTPEQADVILTTGAKNFKDERVIPEGQERTERTIVTIYDKDVLLAGLVPDAKAIDKAIQQELSERKQAQAAERAEKKNQTAREDSEYKFER